MRLIDADAFKKYICDACNEMSYAYKDGGKWAKQITEDFCMDIDEQPTIIEDLSDIISRKQAIERLIRLTGCETNEEITARMDASVTDSEGWLGGVAACIDELEDMPGEWEAKT